MTHRMAYLAGIFPPTICWRLLLYVAVRELVHLRISHYTAQRPSWKSAGVEPVHWKPANDDPGSLIKYPCVCVSVVYVSVCLLSVCLCVCCQCVCVSVVYVSVCLLSMCLCVCCLCVCMSVVYVSVCLLFMCLCVCRLCVCVPVVPYTGVETPPQGKF